VHKVSLREDVEKEGSEPPETLKVQLQSGHSLVGLILVRNRNQDGAKHPYLTPETIRSIPNPSFSNDNDACNLTCASLQILNSTRWLNDELVQAMTHIMFSALLSNHKGSQLKIAFRSSLAFVSQFMQRYRHSREYVDLIKKNDYVIYTVNIGNYHWICLCIAMVWKKVFTLDSFNDYDKCKKKANLVIDVLNAHYNEELTWVKLKSPSQDDGCSCGIFSALNASFFLKTILEGSMTENGPDVTNWSKKRFSGGDKAEIRETLRSVIYDVQDGSALLKWIN
jgi:Ulp1 family protease